MVTNEQCPRFVYVKTGIEHGLGDQLERIFLAMSLIHGRSSRPVSYQAPGSSSLNVIACP